MQTDLCGCLEAGCVAQQVSVATSVAEVIPLFQAGGSKDSIACFASYQPAAGNQIFAHAECRKECINSCTGPIISCWNKIWKLGIQLFILLSL